MDISDFFSNPNLKTVNLRPVEPLADDSIIHREYTLKRDEKGSMVLYEKVDNQLIQKDFIAVTPNNIVKVLSNKMAIIHWSQIDNVTQKEPSFYAVAGYNQEEDRNSWHISYDQIGLMKEKNWYKPERDTDFDSIMDTARGTLQILTDAIYYLSSIGWLPVVRNVHFTDEEISLMTNF